VEEAKQVVKMACELDPDLRLVVLDHPQLSAIWWPPSSRTQTSEGTRWFDRW